MNLPLRQPSRCPKCGQNSFHILESRSPGKNGTYVKRRRKECRACNYMMTTYELDSKEYEEYLSNKKLISKLRTDLEIKRSCHQCTHYYAASCRLDIPELDAEECAYFAL